MMFQSIQWRCRSCAAFLGEDDIILGIYDVRCRRHGTIAQPTNADLAIEIGRDSLRCESGMIERARVVTEREKRAATPRGL